MSLELPSNRPQFSDFPKLYDEDIAPMLAQREGLRKQAVKKAFSFAAVIAIIAIVCVIVLPENMKFFAIFLGIAGVVGTVSMHLNKARQLITQELIGKIANQMKFSFAHKMDRPNYFEPFQRLKFFSNFNREHWEDEVKGEYNNQNFILCEADLEYKTSGKNSSTRTVFHGQLLIIDYPREFLGTTVLRRDHGVMNRLGKPGKNYQNVSLVSSEFEKAYEAWSTDQVEARELLDPIMLERFQELERLFNGKGLQAAFVDGKLLIAVSTGDRMNIGSMFKPLEGKARIETILSEFDIIFDLMDVAVKPVTGKLQGALSVNQL